MKRDFYILRKHDNMQAISDVLYSSGRECTITVVSQNVIEANNHISRQLGLPIASKILYLNRLLSVDNVPRCIEHVYADLAELKWQESMNFSTMSVNEYIFNEKGADRLFAKEEILVVRADEKERELLQLDENDNEIMMIKGTLIKDNDRPLAYYELFCDTDFVRYRGVSIYD